jgi:hypothetical protein
MQAYSPSAAPTKQIHDAEDSRMRSSFRPRFVSTPPSPTARTSLQQAVQRQLMQQLDLRWQQVLGSFGLSVLLLGFGALRTGRLGLDLWGGALLLGGGLAWGWHLQQRARWRADLGAHDDWLTPLDQALVAAGWLWAQAWPVDVPVAGPWGAEAEQGFWWPFLAACGYALWRLRQNARRHWRIWHGRALRHALRAHRQALR